MKFRNRFVKLALVAALLCCGLLLGACDGTPSTEAGGKKEYKVTVKDALGNPFGSGIVAQFHKDGAMVAMQIVNPETGIATKELEAGDYTVKLQFTDGPEGYYYVEEGLTLSPDKTEVEIRLSKKVTVAATTLYVGSVSYDSSPLESGCTYVNLTTGERNYFLFTPREAGTYEISVAEGANVTIGYYGAPHFIQDYHVGQEIKDGKFTVSISANMIGQGESGTTVLVLGVDSDAATECVLAVNRIGEPQWNVADEPWSIYQTTANLSKYTLPEGSNLVPFDMTASYNVVYNEADGYYHLDTPDGPLVYVSLKQDSKYLASFFNILDRSGVVRYFYDENDKFVSKVSYSECLLEYIGFADEETGVYPLTEDLKHIIINRAEYVGWFDATGSQYLFIDANGQPLSGINPDTMWLFMCLYPN